MSEEKSETELVLGLLILMAIPLNYLLSGVAAERFWAWFVVPVFAVKPLTLGVATGLAFATHGFALGFTSPSTHGLSEKQTATLVRVVLSPLFFLFAGWIVHCAIGSGA